MKKFTKLFLSCALVSVVAAATAAMASAESVTISNGLGTYDTDTGAITFTAPADIDATQPATFIVYEKTQGGAVDSNTIVAIDQSKQGVTGNDGLTNNGVKGQPDKTAEKTYIVKLGYYNATTFTTKEGELVLASTPAYIVGDADEDGDVTIGDAQSIAAWLVMSEADQATHALGEGANCDGDTDVTISDAQEVAAWLVKSEADQAKSPIGKAPGAVSSN